jgi:Carboxypeptidase regulatory-like domain
MNRRFPEETNPTRPAGLRLRCFLEIVLAGVIFIGSSFSVAQVDCVDPHPILVSHVQGQVFDPFGIPVPEATISLVPSKGDAFKAAANADGEFEIIAPDGKYALQVEQQGFQLSTVELKLGRDVRNLLRRQKLLVLLGFAGSYCPLVTTSKQEFLSATQENIKRLKGTAQKNATQK